MRTCSPWFAASTHRMNWWPDEQASEQPKGQGVAVRQVQQAVGSAAHRGARQRNPAAARIHQLEPWARLMSCEHCTDQDGVPCFPIYGPGPRRHIGVTTEPTSIFGSTVPCRPQIAIAEPCIHDCPNKRRHERMHCGRELIGWKAQPPHEHRMRPIIGTCPTHLNQLRR